MVRAYSGRIHLKATALAATVLCSCALQAQTASTCVAESWISYEGSQLFRHAGTNAYVYSTRHMAIDADGAPNAYHPEDKGIDALANAGYPNGNWQDILVVDPKDSTRPFVQATGPFVGFFVSKTRLQAPSGEATDPATYVDSTTVPYIVFPGRFFKLKGTGDFGDIGMAYNLSNGLKTPFIVADQARFGAPLGEVSIKLAEALGGSRINPRNGSGMPKGDFAYVVFPKSRFPARWPVSAAEIATRAAAEIERVGEDGMLKCVR